MGTIYRNGKVNTIIKNGKIYGYASGGGGEKIKYISSTGSQYVTLPVKANDNNILKIQLKCLCLSEDNATILGSNFSGNSAYLLYASKSSGNLIYKYAIANNYTYIDFPRSMQFDDIELGYDYVKINGTTYSGTGSAIHSDTGYINVFGTPSGYYSECLISEIKIFMNDVLTYHLVPFVNSNNVPCFKDILNNVEYTSATSSPLVYGELKVGSGGTEILSGTTNPTSSQGSNGQIYLKYDEYDYDTFMNDKIIVQINKNDNTDKKLFFIGLEKNANDISITDNDLLSYLSDVTNGYKKAGYSYSQNQVRNGNIGFYNLGDGVKLRSWSIDWTTLGSGTYYSLLDLNEPATSASESSGQTNVYVPSYYDSSNIISSAYLKVNNNWQNLIGSDINDVGNTTKILTPIDMSTFTQYREGSMWYVGISNILASVWDGGQNIGATCYLTNPIDVTNINKLYYELETKNCYGGGSTAAQARWNVMIGLMQTAPSGIVQVAYDSAGFVAGDDFANSNTNYGTQEIDVSNLTGNYYLTVNAHGWNAMISNLRYE